VIYRLTLDPTYTTGLSVGLLIQGGPLGNGRYRFTANSTLKDRSGNPLDGTGMAREAMRINGPLRWPCLRAMSSRDEQRDAFDGDGLGAGGGPARSGLLMGGGWGAFNRYRMWIIGASRRWRGRGVGERGHAGQRAGPYLYLYDAAGNGLASGNGSYQAGLGPGRRVPQPLRDCFQREVLCAGDSQYGNSTGSYQVRMEVARGFSKRVTLITPTTASRGPMRWCWRMVRLGIWWHCWRDGDGTGGFQRGRGFLPARDAQRGNVVELGTTLPSTSTLAPRVAVVDASGAALTDEDGNSSDGHFRGRLLRMGRTTRGWIRRWHGHTAATCTF